jgi:phosphoenolpyruvate carboxykinase (ATP)
MKLAYTRRMVTAALTGELADVDTYTDPLFGLHVPVSIDGVPDIVLRPRDTWSNGADYDNQASKLANMFADNFEQFNDRVSEGVRKAGPSK